MSFSKFYAIPTLISCVLLSACTMPSKDSAMPTKLESSTPKSWIELPAKALTLGNVVRIPRKDSVGFESAKIQSKYDSALGKTCIKVEEATTQDLRLFCQTEGDYWQENLLLGLNASKSNSMLTGSTK
jgi:hypothetical protein